MGRRKARCEFCDPNREDYQTKTIPIDMGEFGKYEAIAWVSGYGSKLRNPGFFIDFGKEHSEPILGVQIPMNYCPYCGTKFPLKGEDK